MYYPFVYIAAAGYSLRYCDNSAQLRSDFESCMSVSESGDIEANLTSPAEPHTPESLTLYLHNSQVNITYFFGIKAVDASGQWSELSNILPAGVYYVPDLASTADTTTQEVPATTTTHTPTTTTGRPTTTTTQSPLTTTAANPPTTTTATTTKTSTATSANPPTTTTTEEPISTTTATTPTSTTPRLSRSDKILIWITAGTLGVIIVIVVSFTVVRYRKLSRQKSRTMSCSDYHPYPARPVAYDQMRVPPFRYPDFEMAQQPSLSDWWKFYRNPDYSWYSNQGNYGY